MEKYNLGPAWVLTADTIESPIGNWTNLGYTRGNIVAGIVAGKVVTNRVDQLGMIPIASSVFQHPNAFEITVPLLDKQIDVLLKAAPGSVKLTANAKDAFALPSGVAAETAKAFCIVPVDQYEEGVPWWKGADVIYIPKGVANISNRIDVKKEPENDDLGAYEVTITHVNHSHLGGIGPIWIPAGGINPVGLNDASSLEHAVPAASTVTALNGAGYDTVRDLVDETGALNVSGGTLSDLRGIEYAFRASGINVSTNSVSEAEMSRFITTLWLVRHSLGLANCVIDISGNNGVDADATARINGTGAYLYSIAAIDQTNKGITVSGDQRDKFYAGREFEVESSTGNDGTYTVSALRPVYDADNGRTTIYVNEAISSAVADGSVNDGLVGAGCTVTTT